MKILTLILSILAIALVIFNATRLNFDALFEGDSFTAVVTIVAALCALILLLILRISKKIEKLDKAR
jgi:Mg2+ and Co2+ transporter CorA